MYKTQQAHVIDMSRSGSLRGMQWDMCWGYVLSECSHNKDGIASVNTLIASAWSNVHGSMGYEATVHNPADCVCILMQVQPVLPFWFASAPVLLLLAMAAIAGPILEPVQVPIGEQAQPPGTQANEETPLIQSTWLSAKIIYIYI